MSGKLENKVALVTGGASGFGRQSAIRLSECGALVCVSDINEDGGQETAKMLGTRGFFHKHDVTKQEGWKEVIGATLDRFSKLDILLNSAGVDHPKDNVEEPDDTVWRFILDVNLHGTFLGCRQVIPSMRRAGGGSIINLGSILGLKGDGGALAYCASKGGVRLLTKSIARYCGKEKNGIRCNAICPGYMLTGLLRKYLDTTNDKEDQHAKLASLHALGRLGDADDVANLVVYLASDDSRFITGAELLVDGGYTTM